MQSTWKLSALVAVAVAAVFLAQRRKPRLRQPRKVCRGIPKVELHFHLHGSIRPSTLWELAAAQGVVLDPTQVFRGYRTLAVCFALYSTVHRVVNCEAAVRRVVREALEDLWLDNVKYAEIRTTPRTVSDSVSCETYLEIVIDEIGRFRHLSKTDKFEPGSLTVRLILSIDRAESVEVAWSTLDLALKFRPMVVGLELGGNPFKGSFIQFKEFFEKARRWFPCTINTAEILDEKDTDDVLEFSPDRIGHFLLVTLKQFSIAKKKNIPIEVCLTSNLKTLEIPGVQDHPTIDRLIEERSDRVSINTDDTGIYMTSLSAELESLIDLGVNFGDIKRLQRNSVKMSFLPDALKQNLLHSLKLEFDTISNLA